MHILESSGDTILGLIIHDIFLIVWHPKLFFECNNVIM